MAGVIFDPKLIIYQMVALQAFYYLVLGALLAVFHSKLPIPASGCSGTNAAGVVIASALRADAALLFGRGVSIDMVAGCVSPSSLRHHRFHGPLLLGTVY